MSGQSVPSFVRWLIWSRGEQLGLIWHFSLSLVAVLAMLYTAYRLGPVVRRLEGKCVRCGYMLRGLPEARCPECGAAFNPADLEEDRGVRESVAEDRRQG
jgi:hypothetical protein